MISPREFDPLVVHVDQFEGPLDLLLHLIRKQDIDIFDIPIAKITEQFLEVIADFGGLQLDRAGEFIEMAATLVRIKAQLLFPRRDVEEDEDPRADLVRRLLEYEHFRDVARALDSAERDRIRSYRKGYFESRPRIAVSEAPLETQWEQVMEALTTLTDRLAEPEPGYRFTGKAVRMDEKIEYITRLLGDSARVDFVTLVAPWGTRMHAVVSLLACLEMAKRSVLGLRQNSPFGPLWIYRKGETDAA